MVTDPAMKFSADKVEVAWLGCPLSFSNIPRVLTPEPSLNGVSVFLLTELVQNVNLLAPELVGRVASLGIGNVREKGSPSTYLSV